MSPSKLRQIAKRVAPLYWLSGLVKSHRFKGRLRRENRAYALKANPTLPPPLLRHRVHGALDEASYLHVGKLVASSLAQCLENHGVVLDNVTILDFGCGPGRIASELKQLTQSSRLFGSDIDAVAIDWARKHLQDVGSFDTNEPSPPTRYDGESFDVIYSVSLFTHLDEALQSSWLSELDRILKPGGTLVATTHGRFALASCTSDEMKELDKRGIAYRVDRKGRFKLDGLPDFYQTTFHTREYVARAWSRTFEVVDHIEGWLGDQDLVVLRRRHRA